MSGIFEVTHRDGAARIGKLVIDNVLSTPAILKPGNDIIFNSGSLWQETRIPVPGKIIILPHKSLPLHTREEILADLKDSEGTGEVKQLELKSPYTGRVIHSHQPGIPSSDLYVLGAAKQLENNSREFVNSIIRIKENTRAGSLLYAPAIATPENLSMLLYMGVDLVDGTIPVIKGYQDIYLTNSGEFHLDRLHELPCMCPVCSGKTPHDILELPKKERAGLISDHNLNKLSEEIRTVREHIRAGQLREYVESRCRVRPWITAALRLVDSDKEFLEKRTPVIRSGTLFASTSESLNRVEIRRFAERVMERYSPPDLDTLVLLPCSAKKPYSTSLSHQKFITAMGRFRKYVHEMIITSPMGIVPRELELMYPAAHYDTPVTGYWDKEERGWVAGCLVSYLRKNRYKNIIAHVDGAYRDICESVEEELGIDFVYTASEGVTAWKSLDNLKKELSGLENVKKRSSEDAKLDLFRAVLDYQFGNGAGNIITEDAVVKAPFPKYQLFSGEQLATLIPQYGSAALSIRGGLRLDEHPYYRVRIGDFVPKSSVLAPGVENADPQIRPGDEVIVEGDKIFGVGRAYMSGWEMKESEKGLAVELRHSKKKTDINI